MIWQWTPITIPLWVIGILSIYIAIHTQARPIPSISNIVSSILIANAVWTISYAIELSFIDIDWMNFWDKVQLLASFFEIPLFLFLIFQILGLQYLFSRKNSIVGLGLYLIITVLVATNDSHHLFFKNATLTSNNGFITLDQTYGPGLFVSLGIGFLIIIAIFFLLLRTEFQSNAFYRQQMRLLAVCLGIPMIMCILDQSGLISFGGVNLSALTFNIGALYFALKLEDTKKNDVLNASYEILEKYPSGIFLVLGQNNHLIDLSPSAQIVLNISKFEITGQPLSKVLPELYTQLKPVLNKNSDNVELKIKKEQKHTYTASLVSIQDWHSRVFSKVILLQKNDAAGEYEQKFQQSTAEIQNLQYITEALLEMEDLSQMRQNVAESLIKNFYFRFVFIASYNENKAQIEGMAFSTLFPRSSYAHILRILGISNPNKKIRNTTLPAKYGMSTALDKVLDGEITVGDTLSHFLHPWFDNSACDLVADYFGARQCIAIPLQKSEKTIGLIFASASNTVIPDAQIQILNRISKQAVVAIENVRLYNQGQDELRNRKKAQTELQKNEERFQSVVETATDGIIIFDSEGKIIDWNIGAEKIFGFSKNEIIGQPMDIILPKNTLKMHHHNIQHLDSPVVQQVLGKQLERRGRKKNGEIIPLEISMSFWKNGQKQYITAIMRDITERKQAEKALMESEEKYRQLVINAREGILLISAKGIILEINPCAEEVTGFSRETLIGQPFVQFLPGMGIDRKASLKYFKDAFQGNLETNNEIQFTRPDGVKRTMLTRYSKIKRDGKTPQIVMLLEDITERKQIEEKLQHDALHDALTGLPNRTLFMDRLKRAIAHKKRRSSYIFAVLFMDLDRFKMVNDTLGHSAGDQLLIQLANQMKKHFRDIDTIARVGGDEFAILLEDINDLYSATQAADRVLKEIETPLRIKDQELNISASIGIVMSNASYSSPDEYIKDADIAMYRAKGQGRARFEIFNSEMRHQVMQRMSLENDLRAALDRNELFLVYQPILNLNSREIVCFEALIRWRHPEQGIISPADFIPLAEETGLIIPIGYWVLREACKQTQHLYSTSVPSHPICISVNLSAKQLGDPHLEKKIRNILDETGLPSSALNLEITESAIIDDLGNATEQLGRLKKLGVDLHLDDFGTGYSSLSYLHQFPMDKIKIDRTFVNKLDKNTNDAGLIKTIALMGRELGMGIIAEGIETETELEQIKAIGCDFGQGFYFYKPLDLLQAKQALMKQIPCQEENNVLDS